MSFNELNAFFEQSFAGTALVALSGSSSISAELGRCLEQFVREEAKHCELWRQLNRLCAPDWYNDTDRYIIRISPPILGLLQAVTARPHLFPMVFWLMLALEEHSIEISRRCARAGGNVLEPHFLAIYRAHLEDEVRHVHLDWHLLEQVYVTRSRAIRHLNASMFRWVIGRFFLRPTGSALRVIDLLIREFPELLPLRPKMLQQLRALESNLEYQEMMYSRTATPIMFALFDQLPEFRDMGKVLLGYELSARRSGIGARA
jgi:hypothetical protein